MKKRSNLILRVSITLSLSLLLLSVGAKEKIQLKLRVNSGETFGLRKITNQKTRRKASGGRVFINDKVQDHTTSIQYLCNVTDVDKNGIATFKVTYHSIHVKIETPIKVYEYDSSKPSAEIDDIMKGFPGLVGKSFLAKITPEGTIEDVSGIDAILDEASKNIDLPQGTRRLAVERNMRDEFGRQSSIILLNGFFGFYPDKIVRVGNSWKKKSLVENQNLYKKSHDALTLK